ncbi:uncharacterized protein LOC111074954 isoform X2 [Drosophila obscura]|uniref:uncharacterized protein LOC111074954 isoform X2 n=1 Tax=Drosophila obscura TaxID=7282 RepID=UPI001BB22BC4|nr:uncharacterized protein LOC111074954 isoform X2 [Drosophila obscura]
MHKTWRKPLHKRKIWRKTSMIGRVVYYMQPLVDHLQDVWVQPLPFPTMLKLAYTCILGFVILLPVLFPLMVILFYFGIFQYVSEQHSWLHFGDSWNLLGAMSTLWNFEVTNKKYQLGLYAHGPVLHLQLNDHPQIGIQIIFD